MSRKSEQLALQRPRGRLSQTPAKLDAAAYFVSEMSTLTNAWVGSMHAIQKIVVGFPSVLRSSETTHVAAGRPSESVVPRPVCGARKLDAPTCRNAVEVVEKILPRTGLVTDQRGAEHTAGSMSRTSNCGTGGRC